MWEYHTTLLASWEICMQVKKKQLETDIEPDMEQCIGHKLRKEYVKAVYCHPGYLTYMMLKYLIRNTRLDEHKLKSRLLEK